MEDLTFSGPLLLLGMRSFASELVFSQAVILALEWNVLGLGGKDFDLAFPI